MQKEGVSTLRGAAGVGGPQGTPRAADPARPDLLKKRRSIEIGQFELWLTHGKGTFHFENLAWVRMAVSCLLRALRLARRGERNALDIQVKRTRFELPGLPPAFDGFKVLFVSDLHIDAIDGLAEAISAAVQPLQYDLCVLGGDYRFEIYGPYHSAARYLERVAAAIQAPCGTVGILGNHDFLEAASLLEGMGVRMLVNDACEVRRAGERLFIVGLDDPHYYGCHDLAAAMRGVPDSACKILAVHSPELIAEAAAAGFALYLCGHTHAGQFRVPLLGPIVKNAACGRRYASGAWAFGRMQGYTSAGAGPSMVPARFFCRPEVAILELAAPRPGCRTLPNTRA